MSGRPFRPEIVSVIDIAARRCAGWSVGLAESAWVVADAPRVACVGAGIPAVWYVDRGNGFRNAMHDYGGIDGNDGGTGGGGGYDRTGTRIGRMARATAGRASPVARTRADGRFTDRTPHRITAIDRAIGARPDACFGRDRAIGAVVRAATTVATRIKAHTDAFPLNDPVPQNGSHRKAARPGAAGTLKTALDGLRDQGGATVILARVTAAGGENRTHASIIGDRDRADGLAARLPRGWSVTGPRGRGCSAPPGFTHTRPTAAHRRHRPDGDRRRGGVQPRQAAGVNPRRRPRPCGNADRDHRRAARRPPRRRLRPRRGRGGIRQRETPVVDTPWLGQAFGFLASGAHVAGVTARPTPPALTATTAEHRGGGMPGLSVDPYR